MRGVDVMALMLAVGIAVAGATLALAVAVEYILRAVRRLEAVAARLETLAHEQVADAKPGPELDRGPLTTDTMEPEDAAVIQKRNRRGYFA